MVQAAFYNDDTFLQTYRGLSAIYGDLLSGEQKPARDFLDRVFEEVESLQQYQSRKENCEPVVTDDYCNEISRRLLKHTNNGEPLSEEEKRELLYACDELRLRCLAAALGAQLPSVTTALGEEDGMSEVRDSIQYGLAGVTSCVLNDILVVLIPPLKNAQQIAIAIDYVHELFRSRHDVQDVVVDFSAVASVPILLIANMIAYRKSLAREGRTLHVGWIREDSISEPFLSRVRRVFSLKPVGGFLFSE